MVWRSFRYGHRRPVIIADNHHVSRDASNRVLREYKDYRDYFLRVSFCEENGEQFQHEARVTSDQILTDQFLARLDPARGGCIVIAGRSFEFLGFSNSSLKAQTCWFMAPFHHPYVGVINSKKCIERIGNFDSIRQPGRYAARVGQAFSDTIGSALVEADQVVLLADIKRKDSDDICRNFSDGVGKISWDLVKRIWETSEQLREAKPTVFQIRFAGAKGMVSEFDDETAVRVPVNLCADRLPWILLSMATSSASGNQW